MHEDSWSSVVRDSFRDAFRVSFRDVFRDSFAIRFMTAINAALASDDDAHFFHRRGARAVASSASRRDCGRWLSAYVSIWSLSLTSCIPILARASAWPLRGTVEAPAVGCQGAPVPAPMQMIEQMIEQMIDRRIRESDLAPRTMPGHALSRRNLDCQLLRHEIRYFIDANHHAQ
jgi:hypothetical protein